jgi:hypothetical protein
LNIFNVVAGLASIVGFGLAAWQFQHARSRAANERVKVVMQRERLDSAFTAAISAAQGADVMVQRAKAESATVAELQSIARVLRGNLLLLSRQLEQEKKIVDAWNFGQSITQSDATAT